MKRKIFHLFVSTLLILSMLLTSIPVSANEEEVIAEKDDYVNLSKIHSSEKVRVVNSSHFYFGDNTRLCRTDMTSYDGWVIYDIENCRDVIVRACQRTIPTSGYEAAAPDFYVSNDLSDWTELTPSADYVGITSTNYKVYDYTVTIERAWNYIKIVMAADPSDPTGDANNIQINYTIINRLPVDYTKITEEINTLISEKEWVSALNKVNTVTDADKKSEFKALVEEAYKAELENCIIEIENSSEEEDISPKKSALDIAKESMEQILTTVDIRSYKKRIAEAYISLKKWEIAIAEIEEITDYTDKQTLNEALKNSYKNDLERCIEGLENNPSPSELKEKTDKLNECLKYFDLVLDTDSEGTLLKERIERLEESLRDVRIEGYRFTEEFEYESGDFLSDKGWFSDSGLTNVLDSDYNISEKGSFEKIGNVSMFKEFVVPMEISDKRDYYIQYDFSVKSGDGFTGIRFENGIKYFGVKTVSGNIYPVLNFDEETIGSISLPASEKYTAVLKIAANKVYLSVYPSDGAPSGEWELSGTVDMGTFEQSFTVKEEYNSGNSSKAPNALISNNVKEVNSSFAYFGDNTRLCRINAASESFVVYNAENCETLKVQGCLQQGQTEDPKFFVSDNGEEWNEIYCNSKQQIGVTDTMYSVYDYVLNLDRQNKYVKILLPANGTSDPNNIQINYSLFECVKDVPESSVTEDVFEVYSDCGIKLYSVIQEENYAEYTKNLDEAVEKMSVSKRLEDITAAQNVADELFSCIYKNLAVTKINAMLEKNKNTLPVLDKISIVGVGKTGEVLSANVIYADVAGNFENCFITWYLRDRVVGTGNTFKVTAECAGNVVRAEAIVKNKFGISSEAISDSIAIREIENIVHSGGGGGGGSSYRSNTAFNSAPSVIPVENKNENTFADIRNHWAKETIEKLAETGIVNGIGDGLFAPEESVTRAQFAAFIARIMKMDENTEFSFGFDDVADDAWYKTYVSYVSENKIMSGDGEGNFYPERFISREEIAKVAAIICCNTGKSASSDIKTFLDEADISDWAKGYVNKCAAFGIITGMPDGSFAPKAYATRAETAVILDRIMKVIGD